ncbi:MAG TPA: SRPBCC family protein [Lacipirellula sp.]
MLANILIGVAVAVAALAIIIALQPSQFRVARTMKMTAPAAEIFPHINDMRNWLPWSPWEKLDLTMKRTYEGAAGGEGQVYSWAGNKNVGEGRCAILESRPYELVRMRLEFIKPFKAVNEAEFTLKQVGTETAVTWAMTGQRNFMFKAMGLLMSMDKMCGSAFEQGLRDLKELVEGEPQSPARPQLVGV